MPFSLFNSPVSKCRNSRSVLLVIQPLTRVLRAIGKKESAEAASQIICKVPDVFLPVRPNQCPLTLSFVVFVSAFVFKATWPLESAHSIFIVVCEASHIRFAVFVLHCALAFSLIIQKLSFKFSSVHHCEHTIPVLLVEGKLALVLASVCID